MILKSFDIATTFVLEGRRHEAVLLSRSIGKNNRTLVNEWYQCGESGSDFDFLTFLTGVEAAVVVTFINPMANQSALELTAAFASESLRPLRLD